MNYEERSRLALLGANVDWRKTPIAHNDGLLADARKFLEPNWWQRGEPRDAQGRAIIDLVQRAGLGTLRVRDSERVSPEFKRERDRQKAENDPSLATSVDEQLEPLPDETITAWLGRLAVFIDGNGDGKVLLNALRNYVARHPATAKAQTIDRRVVRSFLKTAV